MGENGGERREEGEGSQKIKFLANVASVQLVWYADTAKPDVFSNRWALIGFEVVVIVVMVALVMVANGSRDAGVGANGCGRHCIIYAPREIHRYMFVVSHTQSTCDVCLSIGAGGK